MGSGAVEVAVVAEVFPGKQFGGEHDLAAVHGEMLDNVEDGFEDGAFVVLNGAALFELGGVEGSDDGGCFAYRLLEPGKHVGCGDVAGGGEFGIAPAVIGLAGYSAEYPLADVAGKMEHQISDGILVFGASGPDLLF